MNQLIVIWVECAFQVLYWEWKILHLAIFSSTNHEILLAIIFAPPWRNLCSQNLLCIGVVPLYNILLFLKGYDSIDNPKAIIALKYMLLSKIMLNRYVIWNKAKERK